MENKLESPDYQLMDISEAGTTLEDNISTSSASPTISNQAENEIVMGEKPLSMTSNGLMETVTKNMNSIKLTTSSVDSKNNLTLDTNVVHHSTQKLTPVHHHPLMFENDEESEDSCNNTNVSNFPDVVLSHSQRSTTVKAKADLVNIHNNNDAKSRKPFYREPSPVSKIKSSESCTIPGSYSSKFVSIMQQSLVVFVRVKNRSRASVSVSVLKIYTIFFNTLSINNFLNKILANKVNLSDVK